MEIIEIFKLFGSIMVDNKDADKSISKTGKQAEGLGSKMGKGIKTAGKWALGVGAAAGAIGAAAFAMTKKVTDGFDDIAKNARKMGVSTDYYQEMEYWASQNGLSHDNMEKSMKRLNQRIGEARAGNEKYSGALKELGVDMKAVEDGTISTEEVMTQSIQALSEMENAQDKAALASELFGTKLAQELMPAIDAGALSIEDAQKKAEELGIVISEDTLNAAETFNDTWDDLTRSVQAFGQKALAYLMPFFQTLMDWVLEHMPTIQAVFTAVFDVISTAISTVVGWVQTLIAWLGEWQQENANSMSGIWQTIQETFGNVVAYFEEVVGRIQTFWQEHGQQIVESFITYFMYIYEIVEMVFTFLWDTISMVIGLIVPFIEEQLAVIFELWQEHGDKIMAAVDNVFNFIKGVIEFIMPLITVIIEKAWNIIKTVIETVIGIVMGLVRLLASALTGDFDGMKAALLSIWESLWNGIKGILSGAWDLLKGVFQTLWNNIGDWFTGLGKSALQWGKDLITGFWEGIKSMGSWIAGKIGGFVSDKIPGPIKKVLKIASPSRLMAEYGENTAEGLVVGMENQEEEVEQASRRLASASSGAFENNSTTEAPGTFAGASDNAVIQLLMELIQAVKDGKVINLNGRVLGEINDEEQGHRINMTNRRVEV